MPDTTQIEKAAPGVGSVPVFNPWVVAMTVTLATFMQVLDSTIVNVALPHIAGTLGASSDESTWVVTSYLVSSAVVLPMSGWLSNLIGRKRFYMLCVAIFTMSSLLCGIATSLPMLILFRILQGAGGGGMQPTEQAILADTFSAKKRGMGFAVYGVAILVAPAIGPALGGWITDNYSWHWIFFINVPIGILSLSLTQRIVHDPLYLRNMLKSKSNFRVDYWGIGLIVVGVGFLQFFFDKGQESDWFASNSILISFIISMVALVALVFRELSHEHPIMDLRLLKNRNFATAIAFSFILGMVMNGTGVLMPQFLQNILGYTAQTSGVAQAPGAIAMLLIMPLAGLIASKFDQRVVIACGFALTSAGLFYVTTIHYGISFNTVLTYRIAQIVGMPLIFIPISTLNYVGVPRDKFNQVSGISSFIRNLGGGIGVSMLTNFLARQNQIHRTALAAHTNHANPFFEMQLRGMTANFMAGGAGPVEASHRAMALLSARVDLQATVLSFANSFYVLGVIIVFLVPLPFLMRRPSLEEASAGAAAH